jgi:hypothetical protein
MFCARLLALYPPDYERTDRGLVVFVDAGFITNLLPRTALVVSFTVQATRAASDFYESRAILNCKSAEERA